MVLNYAKQELRKQDQCKQCSVDIGSSRSVRACALEEDLGQDGRPDVAQAAQVELT